MAGVDIFKAKKDKKNTLPVLYKTTAARMAGQNPDPPIRTVMSLAPSSSQLVTAAVEAYLDACGVEHTETELLEYVLGQVLYADDDNLEAGACPNKQRGFGMMSNLELLQNVAIAACRADGIVTCFAHCARASKLIRLASEPNAAGRLVFDPRSSGPHAQTKMFPNKEMQNAGKLANDKWGRPVFRTTLPAKPRNANRPTKTALPPGRQPGRGVSKPVVPGLGDKRFYNKLYYVLGPADSDKGFELRYVHGATMEPVFRARWYVNEHGGGTDQSAILPAGRRVADLAKVFREGRATVIYVRLETIFSHGAHELVAALTKKNAAKFPAAHLASIAMATLAGVGHTGFRPAIA